jgi:hypothetical protein
VLRAVYGFVPVAVAKALRAFAGLTNVTLEDSVLAAKALGWTVRGMDFGDAFHLAKAQRSAALRPGQNGSCGCLIAGEKRGSQSALTAAHLESIDELKYCHTYRGAEIYSN